MNTSDLLFSRISKNEDGCWLWMGPTGKYGVGRISVYGKRQLAHIFAWNLLKGLLEKGSVLLRKCKPANCCNPEHYFVQYRGYGSNAIERCWSRVLRLGPDDCWVWRGPIDEEGYALRGGKPRRANQFLWSECFGPIPVEKTVRNKCGNKECCNPKHFFLSPRRIDLVERFWSLVEIGSSCWKWKGPTTLKAYGVLSANVYAHRLSWEIHRGKIPAGMCVLHRCDNPPCSNPEHLFLGTQADNIKDMHSKGRQPSPQVCGVRGCMNGRAVLIEEDVVEIRKSKLGVTELGRQYDVSREHIRRIRKGLYWKFS